MAFPAVHAGMTAPPAAFSADYFLKDKEYDEEQTGKYFAAPEGIRFEGVMDGEPYVMIYNFPKKTAWHLMVKERMYIETPIEPGQTTDSNDLFGGFSFGSACPGEGSKGTRLGREKLHGRSVEKWRCTGPDVDEVFIWYDTKLQAGIKSEDEFELFELRNIKEGRLSGDLFTPPAGYQKLAIPGSPFPNVPTEPPAGRQPTEAPAGSLHGFDPGKLLKDQGIDEEALKKFQGLMGR